VRQQRSCGEQATTGGRFVRGREGVVMVELEDSAAMTGANIGGNCCSGCALLGFLAAADKRGRRGLQGFVGCLWGHGQFRPRQNMI
jgi:hypothetical protein